MKHLLIAVIILIESGVIVAQEGSPIKIRPTSTSKDNFRQLADREKANPAREKEKYKEEQDVSKHIDPSRINVKNLNIKTIKTDNKNYLDPNKIKSPDIQFSGLGDNNGSIPPDIGAAVSPTHLMEALNTQVLIQDKQGGNLQTVSLDNFWSSLGPGISSFDPKVSYDIYNNRWIVVACGNPSRGSDVNANSLLLIAISQTENPLGNWNKYTYDISATNANWLDYPSIGFNKNWIVVNGSIFSNYPSYQGIESRTFVLDKPGLYNSSNTSATIFNTASAGWVLCPALTYDNSVNDLYLVNSIDFIPTTTPDQIRLHKISGTATAPIFTPNYLAISTGMDFGSSGFVDYAAQATVTQKIMNNDNRIQNVVYRNNSLFATHTNFSSNPVNHAYIRWWEITATSGNVIQNGTIEDPTGSKFYAFPSIAVNNRKDVFLGYSAFSGSTFASSAYSFRLNTDPVNIVSAPNIYKSGNAKYYKTFGSGRNRWGDYSSTIIDPDDFSFWTIQEYAEYPQSGSDRWGTEWAHFTPPVADLYIQDEITDNGIEPNPSNTPMWTSTDIWVRNTQDPTFLYAHQHQNPEYRIDASNPANTLPNYVYIKVRNRGGTVSAGNETLHLYWAKASTGLSWVNPWHGGIFDDPPNNTMLMGEEIGTAQLINSIPAGAFRIYEFAWSPRNPAIYASHFGLDHSHFCLLARITNTTANSGMTFPETTNLFGNVKDNNNIAWKNIEVVDLMPGNQSPVFVSISNFKEKTTLNEIQFVIPPKLQGKLKLTVSFDEKFLKRISEYNREVLTALNKNKEIDMVKLKMTLQGIVLNRNESTTIKILINVTDKITTDKITINQFEIEKNSKSKKLIGGQTIEIK